MGGAVNQQNKVPTIKQHKRHNKATTQYSTEAFSKW
jgi:hypothetical protein